MKTFKKTTNSPSLEIKENYIEDNLKDFLNYNGIEAQIHIEDSIHNDTIEGEHYKIRVGYSGYIYFEKTGYPIFGQGYKDGKIKTNESFEYLEDLVEKYNDGTEYSYVLYDENVKEIDSCGRFYSLDDIKKNLPDEWKNEDMQEYLIY